MEAQIAGGAKSPVLHPPRGAPESEKSRKRESNSLIRGPGGERDGVVSQSPKQSLGCDFSICFLWGTCRYVLSLNCWWQ